MNELDNNSNINNTNTNNEAGVQENQESLENKETDLGAGSDAKPEAQEENKENKSENKETKEEIKDDEGKEKNETELFGKPEAYDYKDVKLPENMQLDEAMTGKFNEYASQLNLSQKGANDLMAMAVELTEQTQQQTVEAIGKLQEARREEFKQLLNKDEEVGGANFKESIATANLAFDGFFKDEELRTLIAENGLNVHPKFIKALRAIGSQMKEDTIHSTNNPAGSKRSREDVLFPSMDEKE